MKQAIFILMNNLVGKGLDRSFAYNEAKEFLTNHSFSLITMFVMKYNSYERRIVTTEGTYFATPKTTKAGDVNFLFEDASKIIAQKYKAQLKQEIKSVVISSRSYKVEF
jgi:hypothetical protein